MAWPEIFIDPQKSAERMVTRPGNTGRTERRRPVTNNTLTGKVNYRNRTSRPRQRRDGQSDELSIAAEAAAESAGSASSDDEQAQKPKTSAYSTLLQSFTAPNQDIDRPRKRRKVALPQDEALNLEDGASNLATTDPKQEAENAFESGHEPEAGTDVQEADGQSDGTDEEEVLEVDQSEDEDDDTSSDPYSAHFSPTQDSDAEARINKAANGQWQSSIESESALKITRQTAKDLPLKQRLRETGSSLSLPAGLETSEVTSALFNYHDLLYTSRAASSPLFRDLTSLHILNHVLKGRDRVLRNNTRLSSTTTDPDDPTLRDQGFTRPKVLILLETREQAFRWVNSIMRFFSPEQRENWSRFETSFHDEPHLSPSMPDDHLALFDGNADNDFRFGIKFTRKTIKLFSAFYQADILICSPLGLRRIIANSDPKKRDSDFLSSIEILLLDQVHAMQAQNWAHVTYCVQHLNQQPRDAHGADFTRVKPWYLDGHAKHLRQTLVASSFLTPEINSLFTAHALNIAGRIRLQPLYPGAITTLPLPAGVKQTFSRFAASTPASDPDARFAFFSAAVLPALVKAASASSSLSPAGTLVFIPSYLDFVRVRNFFAASTATENIAFGAVSEYSSVSEARRARSHLLSGKHAVMLYSGRAHHFHRYRVKGVKRVVWYGLPDDDIFYNEVVEWVGNTVDEGKAGVTDVSCRAMFSKWDGMKLERIVGSDRVRQMLTDKGGDTYDFV
ncbi:DUF1253-domain-containing protein [Myriangium duriaei CBS 260.36]|uniref:U3 small nucleolar RNA-associated protein 25 n=1 Tax=Myriangium duriaei CBS 260.36 TaxID=1168546 RepID=A0A9P4MKA5_9PEZI|nr:DUF1253-domain-containing protein [Myriangium duriaei CBS 260.36]